MNDSLQPFLKNNVEVTNRPGYILNFTVTIISTAHTMLVNHFYCSAKFKAKICSENNIRAYGYVNICMCQTEMLCPDFSIYQHRNLM